MGIGKADTVEEVARKVEQGVEIRNNYEVVFHLQQAVPEFLYMISANADLVMESKARWMPVARSLYGQKVVGTVPSSSSSARWARTCCTNGLRNTGARHQSTKNWSSAGCLRASRAWQPSWRVRCTSPISTALQRDAVSKGMQVVESKLPAMQHQWHFGGTYFATPDKLDPKIPFVKREVRQAMNKAVNRQAIADNLLGGKVQPHRVMGFHPQLDSAIWPGIWNPRWDQRLRCSMGTTRPRRRRS